MHWIRIAALAGCLTFCAEVMGSWAWNPTPGQTWRVKAMTVVGAGNAGCDQNPNGIIYAFRVEGMVLSMQGVLGKTYDMQVDLQGLVNARITTPDGRHLRLVGSTASREFVMRNEKSFCTVQLVPIED